MVTSDRDRDPLDSARRIARPTETAIGLEHDDRQSDVRRNTGDARHPKRMSYWDRPKPARDWHWFLGRIGSALIVTGFLMFLFVGYQLWGTGIEAAQSQQRLENAFSELLTPRETAVEVLGATPDPIVVANGDPVAEIEIPSIGIQRFVVAGVETTDLKKGPGHYPRTPFPGEVGNVAIAGHRTTYGEPFRQLDELVNGDSIVITDLFGRQFTYLVTGQKIVSPRDSWVVDTADPTTATLTLTTCHPEFSARQRLIVFAELDRSRSDIADTPAAVYAEPSGSPETSIPDDSTVTSTIVDDGGPDISAGGSADSVPSNSEEETPAADDVFDKGWFSDPSAIPHVLGWAFLDILIVLGSWRIAKRLRNRAIGLALGIVPFFAVLYFVFQNVNRLLPPNL